MDSDSDNGYKYIASRCHTDGGGSHPPGVFSSPGSQLVIINLTRSRPFEHFDFPPPHLSAVNKAPREDTGPGRGKKC